MSRYIALASLLFLVAGPAVAQGESQEARTCRSTCVEACTAEGAQQGCNIAMGLTSCRIRQERCVNACQKKCPRR